MSDSNPIRDAIAQAIAENEVILFMKGPPERPCAASAPAPWRRFEALDAPFAAVDILPDPRIRQELSALSNWPTIPQLFVNGELVGGCDIVTEMSESGELARARRRAAGRPRGGPGRPDPRAPPPQIRNDLA